MHNSMSVRAMVRRRARSAIPPVLAFAALAALAALTGLTACGSDTAAPPEPTPPGTTGPAPTVTILSGNNAVAVSGTELDTVSVVVKDGAGNRLASYAVAWTVTLGGGSVRPLQTATSADGVSRALWTLGPTAGANALTARVGSIVATFSASSTGPFVVASIVNGSQHSCAVTTAGATYCWGENALGQLGRGFSAYSITPRPVRVATSTALVSLFAAANYTCGLTAGGQAMCWGQNYRNAPEPVGLNLRFTSLATGMMHTCGLTTDDVAHCWGDNSHGQLGDGTDIARRDAPAPVQGATRFASISAGATHTCGLTTEGNTACWGANDLGQLGFQPADVCPQPGGEYNGETFEGFDVPCSRRPVEVGLQRRVTSLATGAGGACVLTADQSAMCWGNTPMSKPFVVVGVRGLTSITVGRNGSACGLDAAGEATCWDFYGSAPWHSPPQRLTGGVAFTSLSGGYEGYCGVARSPAGAGYCWGSNDRGQVGDGTTLTRLTPVRVVAGQER